MIDDRLIKIANYFGQDRQVDKIIEEMGELQQALMKYRHEGKGPEHDNYYNLTEEIADCFILLNQLLYLFDIEEDVDEQVEYKINRTLDNYFLRYK